MKEIRQEQLYHLLPSIYRLRDQAQGEPLRALMNALESELRVVEEDIDALYDNWFIETCDEWAISYLASHVGAGSPDETGQLVPGQRRQVANTIGYRRRKGLTAVLEHVLTDVTGWPVRCIEYDQLLASMQHLANVMSARGCLVNLRQPDELATLNGPFETTAHTIDVRNRENTRASSADVPGRARPGTYRPGNLGIFAWRLQSYPLKIVSARAITHAGEHRLAPGCFTFDPLGRDMSLFNQPQAIETLTQPVAPVNLPVPLSRQSLVADLENYRMHRHSQVEEALFEEENPLHNSLYYGPDRALCVLLDGAPLLPDAIISADLSHWQLPPASSWSPESRVAIDVALGRLRFLNPPSLLEKTTVAVNYCYGFSADLGGGPYARFAPAPVGERYRINVLQGGRVATLRQALNMWEEYCRTWEKQHQDAASGQGDRPRGTVHIVDNGRYTEGELRIHLPKTSDLVIEATDGMRPIIEGDIGIFSENGSAHLRLDGLLINGNVRIDSDLNLEVEHCTLMPHGLETKPDASAVQIVIEHSIVGAIHLHNRQGELTIRDSILDHAPGFAIAALHPDGEHRPVVSLERVTIFGRVQARELRLALNVLFTAPVFIQERQQGLVSFSYVPAHSQTPRREHCLPPSVDYPEQPARTQHPLESVEPQFTSTRYGDAAYAQLAAQCSPQIRRGSDNGSEMGVFNSLRQAQRQDNIAQALDEYLPFGLAAGIFYQT